jgi:hypothetical protein
MSKFVEFLKNNSPDLSNYDYKEWSDEVRDKVKSVIENTVPSMRTTESITREASKPSNINLSSVQAGIEETKKIENLDDLNLDLDASSDFEDDLYAGLE